MRWKSHGKSQGEIIHHRINKTLDVTVADEKGNFKFIIDDSFEKNGYSNRYNLNLTGKLKLKETGEYNIEQRSLNGYVYLHNQEDEVDLVKGFWEGSYNPKSYILTGRFVSNFYLDKEGETGKLKKSPSQGKNRGLAKGIFSLKVIPEKIARTRKIFLHEIFLEVISGKVQIQSSKDGLVRKVRRNSKLKYNQKLYLPKGSLAEVHYYRKADNKLAVLVKIREWGNVELQKYSNIIPGGTDLWVDINYPGYNYRIAYKKARVDSEWAQYALFTGHKESEFRIFVFSGSVRLHNFEENKTVIVRKDQKAEIDLNGKMRGPRKFQNEEVLYWWTVKPEKKSLNQKIIDYFLDLVESFIYLIKAFLNNLG